MKWRLNLCVGQGLGHGQLWSDALFKAIYPTLLQLMDDKETLKASERSFYYIIAITQVEFLPPDCFDVSVKLDTFF
jgi:hypothetical protein